MSPSLPTARRVTVYTDQLAGATLIELLDAADEDRWPNSQCAEEWVLLRNWAMQTETLMFDEAEDLEWEAAMRDLSARDLPYPDWIAARSVALKVRVRNRKLAQARLRDRYGFKRPRRWGLVAKDVRRLYARWAGEPAADGQASPTQELTG